MSKVTVARAVFELETVNDSVLFSASVKLSSRLNTSSDASSLTDISAIGDETCGQSFTGVMFMLTLTEVEVVPSVNS